MPLETLITKFINSIIPSFALKECILGNLFRKMQLVFPWFFSPIKLKTSTSLKNNVLTLSNSMKLRSSPEVENFAVSTYSLVQY